jgi:hypothetical protein
MGFAAISNTNDEDFKKSLPKLPRIPDEVKKRFPSMAKYEKDLDDWRDKLLLVMRGKTN